MNDIKIFFKQTFLIAKKDFKYLVFSPLFFVWMGVCFLLLSYNFRRDLFRFAMSYAMPSFGPGAQQGGNIHFEVFVSHVSYINLMLLFAVPALAMKFLSEEKRNGSFVLLMSSPLSSLNIVLGKYMALLLALFLFLVFSAIYPLSLSFLVEIPFGPLISSYMGLFLLAGFYSATCLFASSLTQSLFLSAFFGMILNIGLWFVLQQNFAGSNPIMEYMSLTSHLTNFIKGSLSVSSFVCFMCWIIGFLFLVVKSVEITRWRS